MSWVPPPPDEPSPGSPSPAGGHGAPPHASPGPAGGQRLHAPGAVVSLVAGILGLTFVPVVGSIVALVFGYQSRRATQSEPGRYDDQLGQVGRVLGWIGLGLTVGGLLILAAALFILFAVGFVLPG